MLCDSLGKGERRLQLVFCCRARVKIEVLDLGESRERRRSVDKYLWLIREYLLEFGAEMQQ